jgi:hypothetical protein
VFCGVGVWGCGGVGVWGLGEQRVEMTSFKSAGVQLLQDSK